MRLTFPGQRPPRARAWEERHLPQQRPAALVHARHWLRVLKTANDARAGPAGLPQRENQWGHPLSGAWCPLSPNQNWGSLLAMETSKRESQPGLAWWEKESVWSSLSPAAFPVPMAT